MGMTTTAAVTIKNLPDYGDERDALLLLIEWSKTELEAIECGMFNQTPEQRAASNRLWGAQHAAQQDIVEAALSTGSVTADEIKAITWRELESSR